MTSSNKFGFLRVYGKDKNFTVELKKGICTFGKTKANIRIKTNIPEETYCEIFVDNSGIARFTNKLPKRPIFVNGKSLGGPNVLKHGDMITVFDKNIMYENEHLPQDIVVPEKVPKTPKAGRSSFFVSRKPSSTPIRLAVTSPLPKRADSSETRKSIRIKTANSSFNEADVSLVVPSSGIATPRVKNNFVISSPTSAVKPTNLRNRVLLKSLSFKTGRSPISRKSFKRRSTLQETNLSNIQENDATNKILTDDENDTIQDGKENSTGDLIFSTENPARRLTRSQSNISDISELGKFTDSLITTPKRKSNVSNHSIVKTPMSAIKATTLESEATTSTPGKDFTTQINSTNDSNFTVESVYDSTIEDINQTPITHTKNVTKLIINNENNETDFIKFSEDEELVLTPETSSQFPITNESITKIRKSARKLRQLQAHDSIIRLNSTNTCTEEKIHDSSFEDNTQTPSTYTERKSAIYHDNTETDLLSNTTPPEDFSIIRPNLMNISNCIEEKEYDSIIEDITQTPSTHSITERKSAIKSDNNVVPSDEDSVHTPETSSTSLLNFNESITKIRKSVRKLRQSQANFMGEYVNSHGSPVLNGENSPITSTSKITFSADTNEGLSGRQFIKTPIISRSANKSRHSLVFDEETSSDSSEDVGEDPESINQGKRPRGNSSDNNSSKKLKEDVYSPNNRENTSLMTNYSEGSYLLTEPDLESSLKTSATELKTKKRYSLRRSLPSTRLEFPAETSIHVCGDSTLETVNTSSFVYMSSSNVSNINDQLDTKTSEEIIASDDLRNSKRRSTRSKVFTSSVKKSLSEDSLLEKSEETNIVKDSMTHDKTLDDPNNIEIFDESSVSKHSKKRTTRTRISTVNDITSEEQSAIEDSLIMENLEETNNQTSKRRSTRSRISTINANKSLSEEFNNSQDSLSGKTSDELDDTSKDLLKDNETSEETSIIQDSSIIEIPEETNSSKKHSIRSRISTLNTTLNDSITIEDTPDKKNDSKRRSTRSRISTVNANKSLAEELNNSQDSLSGKTSEGFDDTSKKIIKDNETSEETSITQDSAIFEIPEETNSSKKHSIRSRISTLNTTLNDSITIEDTPDKKNDSKRRSTRSRISTIHDKTSEELMKDSIITENLEETNDIKDLTSKRLTTGSSISTINANNSLSVESNKSRISTTNASSLNKTFDNTINIEDLSIEISDESNDSKESSPGLRIITTNEKNTEEPVIIEDTIIIENLTGTNDIKDRPIKISDESNDSRRCTRSRISIINEETPGEPIIMNEDSVIIENLKETNDLKDSTSKRCTTISKMSPINVNKSLSAELNDSLICKISNELDDTSKNLPKDNESSEENSTIQDSVIIEVPKVTNDLIFKKRSTRSRISIINPTLDDSLIIEDSTKEISEKINDSQRRTTRTRISTINDKTSEEPNNVENSNIIEIHEADQSPKKRKTRSRVSSLNANQSLNQSLIIDSVGGETSKKVIDPDNVSCEDSFDLLKDSDNLEEPKITEYSLISDSSEKSNDEDNVFLDTRDVSHILRTSQPTSSKTSEEINVLEDSEFTDDLQNLCENQLSTSRVSKRLKEKAESKNDLSNFYGVRKLMATPKVQKAPWNDLSSPKGLRKLMATPKLQKEPKNDLSSPKGVDNLFNTNDLNMSGVALLDEMDLFPMRKEFKTYRGKSVSPVKPVPIPNSRKTLGILINQSPDVTKWKNERNSSKSIVQEINDTTVMSKKRKSAHFEEESDSMLPENSQLIQDIPQSTPFSAKTNGRKRIKRSVSIEENTESTPITKARGRPRRKTAKRILDKGTISTPLRVTRATTRGANKAGADVPDKNASRKDGKNASSPKDIIVSDNAEEKNETPVPDIKSTKRGRKKASTSKHTFNLSGATEENAETLSIPDKTSAKRGRKKASTSEDTDTLSKSTEVKIETPVPDVKPTRRGRKKATTSEDTITLSESTKLKTEAFSVPDIKPTRSGRKKASTSEEIITSYESTEEKTETPVPDIKPIRRGRKKASASEEIITSSESTEEKTETPVPDIKPIRRGRKKASVSEDVKLAESSEQKAETPIPDIKPIKRGRKKASASEDINLTESSEEKAATPVPDIKPIRRGRKKANPSEDIINLTESSEQKSITISIPDKRPTRQARNLRSSPFGNELKTEILSAPDRKLAKRRGRATRISDETTPVPENTGLKQEVKEEAVVVIDLPKKTLNRRGRKVANILDISKSESTPKSSGTRGRKQDTSEVGEVVTSPLESTIRGAVKEEAIVIELPKKTSNRRGKKVANISDITKSESTPDPKNSGTRGRKQNTSVVTEVVTTPLKSRRRGAVKKEANVIVELPEKTLNKKGKRVASDSEIIKFETQTKKGKYGVDDDDFESKGKRKGALKDNVFEKTTVLKKTKKNAVIEETSVEKGTIDKKQIVLLMPVTRSRRKLLSQEDMDSKEPDVSLTKISPRVKFAKGATPRMKRN